MTDMSVLSEVENTEKPLQVNIADAIKQLRTIDPRPEARFDLASIDPEKKGGLHAKTFLGAELERPEFAAWVKRENTKRNVYATANEARAGAPRDIKLADEDVGTYRVFFVDIDLNRDNGDTRTKSEVIAEQAGSDYPPALIIDSGNGIWFVWVLKTPATVESIDGASQAAGLIERFKSDASCKEPSRLMRLAGTINRKAGFPDALARVVTASGPKTTPEEIAAWCPPVARAAIKNEVAGQAPLVELDRPESVLRAAAWARDEAPDAVEGDGGQLTSYKVAARIKDFGLSQGVTFDVMLDHYNPSKAFPPWDPDALAEIVRNAYRYGTAAPGKSSPALAEVEFEDETGGEPAAPKTSLRPAMSILFSDQIWIDLKASTPHLIRNWYDEQTLIITYGDSNTGKTHVALDQAIAIAQGRPWAGNETQKGLVVYIAAEGGRGIFKRYMAHQRKRPEYDWAKVPFGLIAHPIDLLHGRGDAKKVVDLVKRAEDHYGEACKLLDLDTVSRALAGGDENASKDMGTFVGNLDWIREQISASVHGIHHSGKTAAKGARGHSLLRAATDTEIEVADFTIACRKQRDQEFPTELRFRYEQLLIGNDAAGRPVNSVVLDPWATSEFDVEMTPLQRKVWDACKLLETRKVQSDETGKLVAGAVNISLIEVAEILGNEVSQSTLDRAFPHLVENGALVKSKRGLYFLNASLIPSSNPQSK